MDLRKYTDKPMLIRCSTANMDRAFTYCSGVAKARLDDGTWEHTEISTLREGARIGTAFELALWEDWGTSEPDTKIYDKPKAHGFDLMLDGIGLHLKCCVKNKYVPSWMFQVAQLPSDGFIIFGLEIEPGLFEVRWVLNAEILHEHDLFRAPMKRDPEFQRKKRAVYEDQTNKGYGLETVWRNGFSGSYLCV